MKLKVTSSNLASVPVGARVSLSNNGADCVRVLSLKPTPRIVASIAHADITFGADDDATSIRLIGYEETSRSSELFYRVDLTFE